MDDSSDTVVQKVNPAHRGRHQGCLMYWNHTPRIAIPIRRNGCPQEAWGHGRAKGVYLPEPCACCRGLPCGQDAVDRGAIQYSPADSPVYFLRM